MRIVWKVFKWIAIALACVFAVAQLWRPARTNPTIDQSQTIQASLQMYPQVTGIIDRSCRDCHSNETRWPWYTNVAPVSWFIVDHVNEGRKEMNLSEWGRYDRDRHRRLLRDMCELVEDGAMPLGTYIPLHAGSTLSADDKKVFCEWANAERNRLATP